MSKARQYDLNFRVFTRDDGRKNPNVYCDIDRDTGSMIYGEVATFMDRLGPRYIDFVVDEIMSTNPFNSNNNGYSIIGSYEETVEIFSPPARAVFNIGGTDLIIPLQDFLDILQEWKDFLNSLPYKHLLSDS